MSVTTADKTLPARRRDLIFRPLGDDGQHVVKDPRTGGYFKLGPQESFLFARLDGVHTAEDVCRAFSRQFGEPLGEDGVAEFLTLAEESGFLAAPGASRLDSATEGLADNASAPALPAETRLGADPRRPPATRPVGPTPAAAPARREPRSDAGQASEPEVKPVQKPKQSILYWRASVFDPDKLFNRLEPRLRFLWTPGFVVTSAAGILAAAAISITSHRELVSDFPLAWASRWEVFLLAWLTLVLATTLHEFAHGLTCKHFGGEVHEVGFLLMFFLPCFFCNVSDAWLFREKSRRLWVTLAGGWCDLCLWSVAVFVWRLTPPDTLPHYLAWVLMGVGGVRSFFNFNPLLKLDGYYLLSDALNEPNLRQRGLGRFTAYVRWLLWGAPRPAGEPRGRLLLAFGLATWAYSVLFLSLMVVGLVHWWGKSWGAAGGAAAVALGLLAGRGMAAGLSEGEVSQMMSSRKGRVATWGVALAAVAAAACVIPVQDRAAGPFKLRSASRAEIRAPVAGFLREVYFDEGDKVEAGHVVVRMDVPDLDSRIVQKEADQAEARAQLAVLRSAREPDRSRADGDSGDVQYWRIKAGEAQVEKLREELWYLRGLRRKQPLASPVAGVVSTPRVREKVGQYFREGELICEVEDASLLEAEVSVPEQDMSHVRPGQRVELKARVAPFDTLTAEVTRVASAAKDAAPPPGTAGATAAAAAPGIGDVPGRVVVYCTVSRPASAGAVAAVRPGMTGHARIDCGDRPVGRVIGRRLMRYVRTEFWW